jgi:RNA polymerase sigma-70 factor (ECF subfamily)
MSSIAKTKKSGRPGPLAPAQLTDEEALLGYRQTGDRELFAVLVRRYQHELYSYLRRYLGNAEVAEDVFQSTFLQVHLKCGQFQEGRRFKPWLYAIATNQAIDARRRKRRQRLVRVAADSAADDRSEYRSLTDLIVCGQPGPSTQCSDRERNEVLRKALDELSDQLRSVVHLVYYQGLRYREAAEVLAVPVGTIKSRLHTAIAQLSEAWKRKFADRDED